MTKAGSQAVDLTWLFDSRDEVHVEKHIDCDGEYWMLLIYVRQKTEQICQ